MKVKIWKDDFRNIYKMIFRERTNSGTLIYNLYTNETLSLSEGAVISAEDEDNFVMTIPGDIATELFQALAEALSEKGVKTDNDHKIKGKLEAVEYHLEDMRKIVFKE